MANALVTVVLNEMHENIICMNEIENSSLHMHACTCIKTCAFFCITTQSIKHTSVWQNKKMKFWKLFDSPSALYIWIIYFPMKIIIFLQYVWQNRSRDNEKPCIYCICLNFKFCYLLIFKLNNDRRSCVPLTIFYHILEQAWVFHFLILLSNSHFNKMHISSSRKLCRDRNWCKSESAKFGENERNKK